MSMQPISTQEPKVSAVPILAGVWQEQNGRVWNGTQHGNVFTWTQDNRVANGITIPLDATTWAIFITFDGVTQWKLTPSSDTNQLTGKSDVFTRQSPGQLTMNPMTMISDVPSLIGSIFTEKSGASWQVLTHFGGYYQLRNNNDGRFAEGYIVRDLSTGKFISFINFHNPTGDDIIRTESMDLVNFPLSNGDHFTRAILQQQQVNMVQQPQQMMVMQQPQVVVVQQQPMMMMPQGGTPIEQMFGMSRYLKVKQRIEPFEVLTGIETENKYDVKFDNGIEAVAMEESDCMVRQFCGGSRPFKMHVVLKSNKQEIITLDRPFKFFFHEVNVIDTTTGKHLGKIKLRCSICSREMDVFDENGNKIFDIISPFCSCWTFYIEKNGERVGSIQKKFSGIVKELFTDADNFGVEFPVNATPMEKAILFGATFLIDFLYFEDNGNNNNNRRVYF
ncbi:hypothetical protein ABK040_002934 [Willaertia magna]